MSKTAKYVVKSVAWAFTSKGIDAVTKLISVPILLGYFGKDNYGLISLAISINAYLQLLDMGVNTGAIKYFSEWIEKGEMKLLDNVARTSISFYGIIGLFNSLILVIISTWGMGIFNISPDQTEEMQNMLLVLASVSIVNWGSSVFNQLLVANEKIYFIQQIFIIRSLLNLVVVVLTIYLNWTIGTYFIVFTILNSLHILPLYKKAKHDNLIQSFMPSFEWQDFKVILRYSLAIVSIGIFSMTASKMRPIILSAYAPDGISVLSEYRVMETISLFVISIGGMLVKIFLPKTTKLLAKNDLDAIKRFTYKATVYTSIVSVILSVPVIINSKSILIIYVGEEYAGLYNWLNLWMITIIAYLHNSPVSSLVLAKGKTRPLVIMTAVSCIVSLIINVILSKYFNVGSAIIGYMVYITMQMLFYYLYFNSKVLKLESLRVFISFLKPTLLGGIAAIPFLFLKNVSDLALLDIIIRSISWMVLYTILLVGLKVVSFDDLNEFKGN